MLSADDPFVGGDFDLCAGAERYELHLDAERYIRSLGGYAEWSPSRRGVRVVVAAVLRGERHKTYEVPWRELADGEREPAFEVYDRARFLTLTGDCLDGCDALGPANQAALDTLLAELLPPREQSQNGAGPAEPIEVDDEELLERARSAQGGRGADFGRLWGGDHAGYSSRSEADLALCSALAFWTGGDHARIDSLFRRSGLMRGKWERENYREATLGKALARRDFYDPPRQEPRREDEATRGDAPASEAVAAIRRTLFEQAVKLEALDEAPAREELPGSAELLYRGQAAILFSERGAGKSTVGLVLSLAATAAGVRVFYWDRENGAALTAGRVDGILDAHPEWGDPLTDGRFVHRSYPRLDPHWQPTDFAAALAGFELVIYDSLREAIAQLGGNPNDEADISRFIALCVTPLLANGASVVVMDNVGHEAQHRPRASSSKLDAIPQAYKVVRTAKFSQAELGSLELICTRSRSGDEDRRWTMDVGAGVFELPRPSSDNPDERAATDAQTKREAFRRVCLSVLADEAPLGRDALLQRVRERGAGARGADAEVARAGRCGPVPATRTRP